MSATPFQGIKYANIENERFTEVLIGCASTLFATATATFNPGLRTPVKVTRKAVTEEDVEGRAIPQKNMLTIEINSLQTDLTAFKNVYLLGKAPTGFNQARLKTEQGNYYNFVNNSGATLSANGSALLSNSWTYEISNKGRTLNLKLESELEPDEFDWMLGSVSAANTGSTGDVGATTPTLVASSYDRTKHYSPGFKTITVDGVNVGVFEDAKLKFEAVSYGKDHKERKLNTHVKVTGEVTLRQSTATDMLGVEQTGEYLEKAVVFGDYAGNTFTFNAGSGGVGLSADWEKSDRNASTKLVFTGIYPNNADESSPNVITWTTTDVAFGNKAYAG